MLCGLSADLAAKREERCFKCQRVCARSLVAKAEAGKGDRQ